MKTDACERASKQKARCLKYLLRHPLHLQGTSEGWAGIDGPDCFTSAMIAELLAAGLCTLSSGADKSASLLASSEARLWLKRYLAAPDEAFQLQHGNTRQVAMDHLSTADVASPHRAARENAVCRVRDESPLGRLARRRGKNGQPFVQQHHVEAGERLRADFTRAMLTPRITAHYEPKVETFSAGQDHQDFSDMVSEARTRVNAALNAVGQELSGILLDLCCFLKGLEQIERERQWPPRSARLVLSMGLEALARHYGLAGTAHGRPHADIVSWMAFDAKSWQ